MWPPILELLEETERRVWMPMWWAPGPAGPLWVGGRRARFQGEIVPDVRRAIAWTVGLVVAGLLFLGIGAVLSVPSVLLIPLWLVAGASAALGFGLLVAAGVPLARVREHRLSGGTEPHRES